jgi:hypothetical protein
MDAERSRSDSRSRAVQSEAPLTPEVLQGCVRWRVEDLLVLESCCRHAVTLYGNRRRLHDSGRREELARDIVTEVVLHLIGRPNETPESVLDLVDRLANARVHRPGRAGTREMPVSKAAWDLLEIERSVPWELPDFLRETPPLFSFCGLSEEEYWSVLLDVFRESLDRMRERHPHYAGIIAKMHFTPEGALEKPIPYSAQSLRRARHALREAMLQVCKKVLAGLPDDTTRRAYRALLEFLESCAGKGKTTFTALVEELRRRFREAMSRRE